MAKRKGSPGGDWQDQSTAKLLQTVRERYNACKDHWRGSHTEWREHYDVYACRQWDPADEQILRDEQRPAVTFNRAGPLIDAVLGHEANNRNEVRYIPRTHGDAAVNEVLTAISKYFLDECDGETHQSDAFRDMLITGVGWTNTRLSDEQNPDYDLVVERIDPFEMLVDPSSREPNFADARYLFRRKRMGIEEVKSLWPNWDGQGFDAEWNGDDFDTDIVHTTRDSYGGLANDDISTVKDILVLEYQWKDIETYHLVEIPQENDENDLPLPPKLEEMDAGAFSKRKSKIEEVGAKSTPKRRITYKRAYIIGSAVVQEDVVSPKSFTYHAITGKRDREKGVWFGLMRALMDPQRWSNKWLAQMMHIINTNATSGMNIEESAIDDVGAAEAKHARPGRVLVFRDGALQRGAVQPVTPMTFPTNVEKLLEYANQSFGDVSGVNQELLGMADREQPGVLEWQRKQSAVSLLAPLFDSLRRYRKMFGRTWLDFIQRYVADGRVARITQDDQQTYTTVTPEIVGDPETARYDVIVDQQAMAPNQKEATWSVLTSLFPAIKDAMDPQTMLLFLEYSPLPTSLVEKLKQQAEQKAQQGPPPDPEMMKAQAQVQATQMKTEADMKAKEQEMAFKEKELQMELQLKQKEMEMDLQIAQQKAQHDAQLAEMQMQMKQQQMQAEQMFQFELGNNQLAFDQERHKADMQMASEKQNHDFLLRGIDANMQGGPEGKPPDLKSLGSMMGVDGMQSAVAQLSQGLQQLQQSQAQQTQMLAQALEQLGQSMSRPRSIVRGPDGRAMGVQ